jgi:His-Xaa-Ser system protein HxsD
VPHDEQVEPQTDDSEPMKFRDGSVRAEVDMRCYRLSAVQKASYKLADRCTVVLGSLDVASLPITFRFPRATNESAALDVVRLFFQELLDQELREQIGEETRPLRALLLAHAFSKTDLIRRE